MSNIIQTTHYIKFIKGTSTAFANLTNKDSNTLYFISDNDTNGLLYLGSKLIGDGNVGTLSNVTIKNPSDQQVLSYDAATSQWVNKDVENVIRVMVGASATEDGMSGIVPAPVIGDETKFLRGDGTWTTPIVQVSSGVLTTNDAGELTIAGLEEAATGSILQKSETGSLTWITTENLAKEINDSIITKAEVQELINSANHLKRQIVDSTSSMTDENTIYMLRNTNTEGNNLYDEYMVIENSEGTKTPEIISASVGSFSADDYVTKVKYNAEVGDLTTLINSTGNESVTIVSQINDLTERLAWGELTE